MATEIRGPATKTGSAFLQPGVVDGFDDIWDRPERVVVPSEHVRRAGVWSRVRELAIDDSRLREAIGRVHPEAYITEVMRDPNSSAQALDACAAVLTMGRAVARGDVRNGYALVRPAGHHAAASSGGGGGCLFAHGAVLARELQALGFARVAIVDWDAHHGNGAQDTFWEDDSVLTISLHQDRETWAGSDGSASAVGAGRGSLHNVNLPFGPGAGGAAYALAMKSVVAPLCDQFAPDIIIVSCGFDGSNVDPAARLQLCAADYFEMTRIMMGVADTACEGRLVMLHEGGYAVSYVAICLEAVLLALSGGGPARDRYAERWGDGFAGEARPVDREIVRMLVEAHQLDVDIR
ncbi:arginase family protein [Myceligenerans halotolerans]